jgi:IS30 family transposase
VVPKKVSWDVKASVYRELIAGRAVREMPSLVGVDMATTMLWAKLAGMRFTVGRAGGVVRMPVNAPPPVTPGRQYRRLTAADRAFIQAATTHPHPWSQRAIARELRVSPSTISREIRAHQIIHWRQEYYDAEIAHYRALAQRHRRRPSKLAHRRLRAEVVSRLNNRFSPQQISGELRTMFPDELEMNVSHETIYQALYVQGKGSLRHELAVVKAIRSGRTARTPKSKLPPRPSRPWLDGARLSERPADVEDRAVPGHWEGDLVVGPGNSGIVTLVERSTRFALIGRLPGMRDSATVTDVLAGMIVDLPAALKRTITWDQGTEMAAHAAFTIRTGCPVFFCDPHSPWQRGTNENTNGLIRDFYPKGTNFNDVTDADIADMQRLLNIRPRQTLGWRSPSAMLNQLISSVALAT